MKNQALIDWLSFSAPLVLRPYEMIEVRLQELVSYFFGRDFSLFTRGNQNFKDKQRLGWYKQIHTLRGIGSPLIHVLSEPTSDKNANTVTFHVTGYGWSSQPDALNLDLLTLLAKIRDAEGQLTRADLALDSFSDVPLLELMTEASHPDIWRDRIITGLRFKKVNKCWSTLYYGENPRGNQIIAYDKAAETETEGPWFRCEFRARDRDLLKQIQNDLLSSIPLGKVTVDLIYRYLRFVPPGRKSKYDRPEETWWTDFIGDAEKYTFARHRSGKDSDEPPKAPTGTAVERYLRNALRGKNRDEIEEVIRRLADELTDKF